MKNLLIFFTLLLLSVTTKAQNTFYKSVDTVDHSTYNITNAQQTADGGYLLAGNANGIGLIKTDALGDTLWTKTYWYSANSMKLTADQGCIIAGHTNGISNMYVLKVDAAGTILWEKIIGDTLASETAKDVELTSDGGYIVTGYKRTSPSAPQYIFTVKLDAAGTVQWSNTSSIPGRGNVYSALETNDGGYLLTGEIDTAGSAGTTAYLIKLNHTGAIEWSKALSGSNGDKAFYAVQTPDNGFLISGERRKIIGGSFYTDMTVIKTDSMGNPNWAKIYVDVRGGKMTKTSSGDYIIAAMDYTTANMLFLLMDINGNILWNRLIWDPIVNPMLSEYLGINASQTSDGGFVFSGYADGPASEIKSYFVKTDAVGSPHCNDSVINITVNTFIPIVNTQVVTNTSGYHLSIPATIVSSGVDVITTYCISTGIEEKQNEISSIPVYPNPSTGIFNFSGLEKESTIQIMDLAGRTISKTISMNDLETIDLSGKAKGIYFYTVIKNEKSVQRGKIIID